jgi:bifunctional non-homologous end joining protein LigD
VVTLGRGHEFNDSYRFLASELVPIVRRPPEFIVPCSLTLRARSHRPAWLHEIKFDGWRIQLHKRSRDVALCTKNGHDYTKRLPAIAAAAAALPVRSAIIDGELTATDERGLPDFRALHFS